MFMNYMNTHHGRGRVYWRRDYMSAPKWCNTEEGSEGEKRKLSNVMFRAMGFNFGDTVKA